MVKLVRWFELYSLITTIVTVQGTDVMFCCSLSRKLSDSCYKKVWLPTIVAFSVDPRNNRCFFVLISLIFYTLPPQLKTRQSFKLCVNKMHRLKSSIFSRLHTYKFFSVFTVWFFSSHSSHFRAVSRPFRPSNQHVNKSTLFVSFCFRTAISNSHFKLFIPLADLKACL